MRVITGTARGRKLKTLEGEDIRPTTDMVKEAIFSVIQFELDEARVLDLFCGSGQLGIEAISRGAKECRFVDVSAESINCAKENVINCKMNDKCSFTQSDSIDFLRMARMTFDIAFLDPPYRKGLLEKVLPLLAPKMSERGIIVCEHENGLVLPDEFDRLKKHKTYRYGKIGTTVYKVPLTEV